MRLFVPVILLYDDQFCLRHGSRRNNIKVAPSSPKNQYLRQSLMAAHLGTFNQPKVTKGRPRVL